MRRVIRAALTLTITVSVLLGFLAYALATGRPADLRRVLVQWATSRALEAEVRIGRITGSPFDALLLEDVSIASAEGAKLEFRSIRGELAHLSLRERRLGLDSLRLVGCHLGIERDASGTWSLAGWSPDFVTPPVLDEEARAAWVLSVRVLAVEDVRVDVVWDDGAGRGGLRGQVDLEARDVVWPPTESSPWPGSVEARMQLKAAGVAPRDPARGVLVAQLREGILAIRASGVEGAAGRIDAEMSAAVVGSIEAPVLEVADGTLSFEDLDLSSLLGDEAPESALSGRLTFDWNGKWVEGEVLLDASEVSGIELDAGELHGRVWRPAIGLAFELDVARLETPSGRIDASLSGDEHEAHQLSLRHVEVDLSALPSAWQLDGWRGGTVSLEGELAGPWEDLKGDLAVALRDGHHSHLGSLSGHALVRALGADQYRVKSLAVDSTAGPLPSFHSVAPFELRRESGGAVVRDAHLRTSAGGVRVDGGFADGRFLDLHLRVADLDAGTLAVVLSDVALEGSIDADVHVDGPPAKPRLNGALTWREPRAVGFAAQRAHLEVEPEGAAAHRAHVSLVRGEAEVLELRAVIPTSELLLGRSGLLDSSELSANLVVREFDAAWIRPVLPAGTPVPSGTLSGHATLQGPLRSPGLDAAIDWTAPAWGSVTADHIVLHAASPSEERPLRAEARVQLRGADVLEAELELRDRERLAEPSELLADAGAKLRVRLREFELGWIRPPELPPTVRADGRLSGELHIHGGPVPQLQGKIELREMIVAGPPMSGEIGPASTRIEFVGSSLRMAEMAFPSGDGELRLRGHLSWHDPSDPAARLNLRLTSFAVQQPGVIEGVLDGDIVIEGRPDELRAEGGLNLHHARLDLPDPEDPIVREIRVQRLASQDDSSIFQEGTPDALEALEGEIVLRFGESVRLRGIGADLELGGELIARKRRGEEPGLYGSVGVPRGRFDFRGKWLRVLRGSALFDGSPDPDPFVDALAVHRVRDVEIRVRLVGRASALQLEFDSDPPMSREEQLSYLLFDRPTLELGPDDQTRVGVAAGVLAGDLVLGQIGNEVAREFWLDRIRLGLDDEAAPALEIEKQIHDRVTARYGRSFGTNDGDRFVVEWRFFRSLFLSGEQETSGNSAIDVFWRYDY
jgi:autotransporter translocation and assembly factor TamB